MKNTILKLLLALFICSFAHDSRAQQSLEQEAVAFAGQYQKETNNKNIAFLEKHLDDTFISVGPNSSIWSKSQALENARRPGETQDFKVMEVKGVPVKTISSGNIVVLISNWKVVRQANAAANAAPQIDSGTTTAVYQKTDAWRILSEHVAFDRPLPSNELGEIGRTSRVFDRALVFRNYNDVEPLLTQRYMRVDENGSSMNKTTFLSDLREGRLVILSVKTSNVYINRRENSAVETGMIEVKGKQAGAGFAKLMEYTRMWTKTEDRWRVSADYFASVAP